MTKRWGTSILSFPLIFDDRFDDDDDDEEEEEEEVEDEHYLTLVLLNKLRCHAHF